MSSNHHMRGSLVIPTTTKSGGIFNPTEANRNRIGFNGGHVEWPGYPQDPLWANVVLMQHFNRPYFSGSGSNTRSYLLDAAIPIDKVTPGIGSDLAMISAITTSNGIGGNFGPATGVWSWFCSEDTGSGLYTLASSGTDLVMGTGDFTAELFFNSLDTSYQQMLADNRPNGSDTLGPVLFISAASKLTFYDTGANRITGGTSITGGWHHCHMTRVSGTTYLGLDGAQEGSDYIASTNYVNPAWAFFISAAGTGSSVHGYLAEVRITKGTARYARSYTVPTLPLPDY